MGILDGKVAIVTGGGQNIGRAETIALTRSAARERGKYGIRVHALAPVARTSEFDVKLSREQEELIRLI